MFKLIKPQLVVFDLDNTIYDYEKPNRIAYKSLVSTICAINKVEHRLVEDALSDGRDVVKKRLGNTAASHSRLLYLIEAFRILGIKTKVNEFLQLEDKFWGVFLSEMELFPGVNDLFAAFKNERIPLGLVTDLTTNIQYRKISKLGLDGLFDVVITSEEAGGDKISGLPFKLLEETTQISPSDSWFFGDSSFDFPMQRLPRSTFFRKVAKETFLIDKHEIHFDNYFKLLECINLKN